MEGGLPWGPEVPVDAIALGHPTAGQATAKHAGATCRHTTRQDTTPRMPVSHSPVSLVFLQLGTSENKTQGWVSRLNDLLDFSSFPLLGCFYLWRTWNLPRNV